MASPSQATVHYEQGKLCYQNKKFHEAIAEFTESIKMKPEEKLLARCFNARGVVYFYLGEFKKVIKDCTEALKLDADNANYHNCRGNAYFSLGKFGKAAEDFTAAIKLSPEASHGRYYNNRGSAYRRLKMFKEAIDDYTMAINIDPKNGNYYNNRGNTYFDMGEFQLAIDDFTTALGLEPYSPKTRLTLAQAHEALAQEKRMKNSTQYQGIFSSLKNKAEKKKIKSVRKDRPSTIYVSPAGVEVTFVHGSLFKKKAQQSFQWSEDMKIELVDDSHVKLFLDSSRNSWIIITPCEATAVEEELIGRITTKFASYSTACLVAQHEGVCNEYTDIIKHIKQASEQLTLLEQIYSAAVQQKDEYVKSERFELADKAKAQCAQLEQQIAQKKQFIESETTRAESVRQKAEAEAGPVLDMVQIMQNRVQELFHTRVKSVKDKYKVDDLELEEQLAKMQQLVQRARELCTLVSRPVSEIRKAFNANVDVAAVAEVAAAAAAKDKEDEAAAAAKDKDSDDEDEEPARATPAPAPAPSSSAGGDEEELSDWDDIDESALPEAFAPSGSEVFMTVEAPNGMITITPSKSSGDTDIGALPSISSGQGLGGDVVLMRKASLITLSEAQKLHQEKLSELEKKTKEADDAVAEKDKLAGELSQTTKSLAAIKFEMEELRRKADEAESKLSDNVTTDTAAAEVERNNLATLRAEMALLREQQQQAEAQLREKDEIVQNLQQTTDALQSMKAEADRLKIELAEKVAALEGNQSDLSNKLEMTAQEKYELESKINSQSGAIADLKAHLDHVNKDLGSAARDALEKTARLHELEQHEVVMAQALEDMKNMTEQERKKYEEEKSALSSQLTFLESTSKGTLHELEQTKAEKQRLEKQVEMQSMTLTELRRHLAQMQKDLESANDEKRQKATELESIARQQEEDKKLISDLKEQSRIEEIKRRELHNLIQEIKGNIRVYVRIRPTLDRSKAGEEKLYEKVPGSDDQQLQVVGPTEESSTGKGAVSKKWTFEFDRVFWPDVTQGEVFKEISQLVQSALDGYKVCIFAYGQTGSGKTHTMEGPDNPDDHTEGMIPRSVKHIFKYREEMIKKGWSFECEASFLEIYLQTIRDLLSDEDDSITENKHEIRMVKKGKGTATVVADLRSVPVSSADELRPLLKRANASRSVGATKSNTRSSRSHSVFSLKITGKHKESGQETEGILNLIDLAGSERLDKSQATGQRLEETKAINSSLTCLGDVIAALAQGNKHVPYRNSKLTYLLQDCFGGGSKTLMFINVAPESEHISESLCSLRFGSKVHDCHIGTAKKTVKQGDGAPAASPAAAAGAKAPVKKK